MTGINLKEPRPISYDEFGQITAIRCKVCGVEIARARPMQIGSRTILRLARDVLYAEAKFECVRLTQAKNPETGKIEVRPVPSSFHVTHGCRNHINMGLSQELMLLMLQADLPDDRERIPVRVLTVDYKHGGIA